MQNTPIALKSAPRPLAIEKTSDVFHRPSSEYPVGALRVSRKKRVKFCRSSSIFFFRITPPYVGCCLERDGGGIRRTICGESLHAASRIVVRHLLDVWMILKKS